MKSLSSPMLSTLLALLPLSLACGKGGDSPAADGGETEPTSGGTVDPGAPDVTGTFYLGDTATPASGYELWLVDLTASRTIRTTLSDAGTFSLALDLFVEDHLYSLHLVQEYQLVGTVDLGPAAGLQPAFVYGGGYGFALGDVIVPVNDYGQIAYGSSLTGKIAGGFALEPEEVGAFNDFPVPEGVVYASFGHQLVVTEPNSALYSFYRADENPQLYAQDLAAMSRLGAVVGVSDGDAWSRAFASEAGAWLRIARRPTAADTPAGASAPWAASRYDFGKTTENTFEVAAYPGGAPRAGTILVLRMQPADGAQVTLQRAVDVVVGMPPKVVAGNAAGGATATIDYTATSGVNGLTRPFCQTGDVTLDLNVPEDIDGAPLVGTFDRIDIEIDYYGRSGGKNVLLKPKASQFSAPHSAVWEDAYGALTRSWAPDLRRLRFALDAAGQAAASHTIGFDATMLPAKLGTTGVYGVRLRVYYRSSASATEAATVFWLTKDC